MKLRDLFGEDARMDPQAQAVEVTGLSADSRIVKPGDLFFALSGSRTDGARFIDSAIRSGAAAVAGDHAPSGGCRVPFVTTPNPRRAIALAAAKFYPRQPSTIAAVTGTSGKTSVAAFTRQIWLRLGHAAASIGTIGLVSPKRTVYGSLTTPDPVALHRQLDEIAGEGVTHLAFEASSHGLDQHRLDGVRISAGAFTNLSRDHMDYHPDVAHYLAAKLRLFRELVPPEGAAVISADHDCSQQVIDAARERKLRLITVGRNGDGAGEGIGLIASGIDGFAQLLELTHLGRKYSIRLPLVGEFQIENAIVAAGLAIGTGSDPGEVFAALEHLEGAKGRLERVGDRDGAPIFVDYAHKPDALAKALQALRPYAKGRLVVVLGAGGDRDAGKRPLMGAIAAENADRVIVTDDNPRSENPQSIRAAILATCGGAEEIGDRTEAIRTAIAGLQEGDVLLIAGKGHETGQIVGDGVLPFSDHDAVASALAPGAALGAAKSAPPLWTSKAMAAAMRAQVNGALPDDVTGISIDSRTLVPGEAYFAIKGAVHDGHDFVEAALKAGAALAVVDKASRGKFAADAPLLVVDDVLGGLVDLGRAARARLNAQVIAVTGSVGKTSTKEALRRVFAAQGETHASAASFNNHWGVPLSLARCPATARFAVFEIGMNHAGEIEPLVKMVRPHVAIITTVEPVHLEFFDGIEAIADAKAEIFAGLEPGGTAVLNRDNSQFARLERRARELGVSRVVSFGSDRKSDARLIDVSLHAACSAVHADILGHEVTYKVGMPGRHMAMNSLAVLAAASLAGADLALASLALSHIEPAAGRGVRRALEVAAGEATLIDESYNANPASMAAALSVLGQARIGPHGRRIAVLGDMLELGSPGPELHRGLNEAIKANQIDLVFCCGPLMRNLWDALSTGKRGGYADSAANLETQVVAAIRPGDAIMIKGSFGSKMKTIVNALEKRFPGRAMLDEIAVQGG